MLGTACSEGEVFDAVLSSGVDAAVKVAKYYDFIEVMPPVLYAPLLAQGTIKDEEGIRQVIRDLLEVGRRLNKPVFGGLGMSIISSPKMRFTVKSLSVV